MPEQHVNQSLADRALQRLRRLATGNGLEPAAISVLEIQEKTFDIEGRMEVSPVCEDATRAYPGHIKDRTAKASPTIAAMQDAAERHRKNFRENPDWIEAAIEEIKTHDSQGWGLEDARVTLPQKSATFAATEICASCGGRQMLTCVQCQGQGTVICTQCQGQGRELCYYCGGHGENPQQPGQRCTTCNGTRFAPCRFCQTRGHLSCPTCAGKRGTPCRTCESTGKISHEITVTCGADMHFKLMSEGLPSGLRRGLDRIGVAKLGKGHGDITAALVTREEREAAKKGAPIPVLKYRVALPYAELRTSFGNKKAIVAAVGKRCALNGVPSFLDESLRPWRDNLHKAALGQGSLEAAVEARALAEILALIVAGKNSARDVRSLYPFGFSTEAIGSILSDMRLALNRTTLKIRAVIALVCGSLSAALFYGLFLAGGERALGLAPAFALAADLGALAAALAFSWAALNFSTRFVLRRRFPKLTVALKQKIGRTGWAMLAGITLIFALMVAVASLAAIRPLGLAVFL